jgi:hypothetical protein
VKKQMAALSIAAMLLITGCSGEKPVTDAPPSEAASGSASPTESGAASPAQQVKETVELKSTHLTFLLPETWSYKGTGESFSLLKGDKAVGALEGMGYSESIDNLLPNGASVTTKEELEGFPVKVERVQLSTDTAKEIHYFFEMVDAKAIYDLRFDAEKVTVDESMEIAKTAMTTK